MEAPRINITDSTTSPKVQTPFETPLESPQKLAFNRAPNNELLDSTLENGNQEGNDTRKGLASNGSAAGFPFPSTNGDKLANADYQSPAEPHKYPNGSAFAPALDTAETGEEYESNVHTPPARRSVQFARTLETDLRSDAIEDEAVEDDPENNEGQSMSAKLLTKLRSITQNAPVQGQRRPQGSHSTADGSAGDDSTVEDNSPTWKAHRFWQGRRRSVPEAGDTDTEQSGDDARAGLGTTLERRLSRRHRSADFHQSTPTTSDGADYGVSGYSTPSSPAVPRISERRVTTGSRSDNQEIGLSEDEGRDRRNQRAVWKRRGSGWMHNRGYSYSGTRRGSATQETSEPPRIKNLRRLTGFTGGTASATASPSPWKVRSEIGAQKWRQLKAGLRLMGQKKKEQNKMDHVKSAELMAELLAGSPAALILASNFMRDDERKRVPILLEQLKVSIVDSQRREDTSGDRHVVFRLELEYGSGLTRMKWTIWRTLRDFANLHLKCKLQNSKEIYISRRGPEGTGRTKLPRFPRSAFPYLRGVRGLADEDYDDEENADDHDAHDTTSNAPEHVEQDGRFYNPGNYYRRKSSNVEMSMTSPLSPVTPVTPGAMHREGSQGAVIRRNIYAERQRKKLENYLRDLIRYLLFRPGSNRLCRFLELSALGVRLSMEGGYHGKEGTLVIQSSKGMDFRKAWSPALLVERHKPMWFLVRDSYIVSVDSPENMHIYDVFMVDEDFAVQAGRPRVRDQTKAKDIAKTAKNSAAHPQHDVLRIKNAERSMKLVAKNERQLLQFEESMKYMASNTEWARKHRFNSFAPIRKGVYAQWLVDGRDYMWNMSRAISQARDVIYLHDWWISPELYMRRPPAISQKWRLDRLLKQKAQEGVKVFVIVYRNINQTIPIDSEWTKFSLLDLHPNIFVQRSPNQVRQNVFFWAHHEKLCIVDHAIAFLGGMDLCFGRWDTPQHPATDDKPTGFEDLQGPKDADHCQLFVGKDYSNPRVLDYYNLDKPYEEMYDREKVIRSPWHDVGMQIVGQPARDLTRHFVQRWNYILRQRKPSRPTPFLLPPPDLNHAEIEEMGLGGTCTIQTLRSAGPWSMGTPNKTEHSIMDAYCKLIQTSEHFVYIENQFFVSSCTVEGTKIENHVGDALVERIIRAHKAEEDWLAVILIPLVPGFQNTVDVPEGGSIRLIMQCQYRTICRGRTSIFERLRAEGIVPEDYIRFYSLRSWGKVGPSGALATEQLYIHAKCMIVDDRYAIIGSANINERSMLGNRDSEIAALVWDSDTIDSVMGGEDYKVGRFPHTLRMRLMREHMGIDVDKIMDEEREKYRTDLDLPLPRDVDSAAISIGEESNDAMDQPGPSSGFDRVTKLDYMHTFNHDVDWEQESNPHLLTNKRKTTDHRVTGTDAHRKDVEGYGNDNMHQQMNAATSRARDSIVTGNDREIMVDNLASEGKGSIAVPVKSNGANLKDSPPSSKGSDKQSVKAKLPPPPRLPRLSTYDLGLPQLSQLPALPVTDDTDIGGPPLQRTFSKASGDSLNPLIASIKRPLVDKDCMKDPLSDSFAVETWQRIAENNTKLFRQVFRCMPDNQVTTWKEYEAYVSYGERFAQSQGLGKAGVRAPPGPKSRTGPVGHAEAVLVGNQPPPNHNAKHGGEADEKEGLNSDLPVRSSSVAQADNDEKSVTKTNDNNLEPLDEKEALRNSESAHSRIDDESLLAAKEGTDRVEPLAENRSWTLRDTNGTEIPSVLAPKRRRRATTKSSGPFKATDPVLSKGDAEELMKLVQGHLVEWPYDWLLQEERGGKWLYSVDQMQPLDVYD